VLFFEHVEKLADAMLQPRLAILVTDRSRADSLKPFTAGRLRLPHRRADAAGP
jgi:hypothetical protein